jgi:hypothetical protein
VVYDIAAKLPAQPAARARRPFPSAAARAWLATHLPRVGRELLPTLVIALAAGMLGWLAATAAAALNVGPPMPAAMVVALRLARWTFVASATLWLFRFGFELELRRWRRQPATA